jgi:flavin reductase (DIM6/NTAB) family NADH-FMN oxidoreductase RutF
MLPPSLKRRLRSAMNFPRYGVVPGDDPQPLVGVRLEFDDRSVDVTSNNVVTALRPFTIGIMLDAGAVPQSCRLSMNQRASSRLLGTIHLRLVRAIPLGSLAFCLFEVTRSENYCVPAPILQIYYWREQYRFERRCRKNPHNFRMTIPDLRASYVFYICPRPVVLVTVQHGDAGNMFPMDLIGPTNSRWFSMALRSTSPAVELMRQSGRMALASVPYDDRAAAYDLGRHHRERTIDWAGLPFPTVLSPGFQLPAMQHALRVREVSVEAVHEVGSHVLFLTSIASDTGLIRPGIPQMFHRFQSYREFRSHSAV